MLTISDISFLSKKTKLSKEKTHLLFEEKGDGDLVLEQLGRKRLTKKELLELSFPLFIKLLINKEAKTLDQKYKNYISDFVGVFYPQIMMAKRIKTKVPRKHTEENAQYFFTLASFFAEDMAAQMSVTDIHKILKYTMDSFVEFKGKGYVSAISDSYEYLEKIKKKWMS
tara:strand:+ start:869 stop:1375 length:507 start_codon:yes stop_codon:yes gene_type:complete